jgi:uncharacterized protein YydD (DUF2326 family)
MRLIELTSSRHTFKPVHFNASGLSLIVGKHSIDNEQNIQLTYNGVGKSLLTVLIHFCLGANRNSQLEAHLKDWDFTLSFSHEGKTHIVTRVIGSKSVHFDGEELPLRKYTQALDQLNVFHLPAESSGLSFRGLIKYFLRPGRDSYTSPEIADSRTTAYQAVLNQSFLLGLDYFRAIQKHDSKKRLDEQKALENRYRNDSDLRQFYLGEKNAEIELAALSSQIEKLEQDLANFKVASDYSSRELEADTIRSTVVSLRNREALLNARIRDIELSLSLQPDILPDRVQQLYREAKIALPEQVIKQLEDVEQFHSRLRQGRQRRLTKELEVARAELSHTTESRAKSETQLDSILQYLSAHRALDEYTENNRYLSELVAKRQKVADYLALIEKYRNEAQKIRADMGQATVETTNYLESIRPHRELLMTTFRRFASRFYGDRQAGLTIQNNDSSDNQIRYNISTHIEHDQADGINDVRIFCFDLLLLTLQQRHDVKFLFHDSRLFADMDWHQRLTLFRLAHEVCHNHGWQYIASINEDQLESMRSEAGSEFDELFVKSRILELTDEPNGSGKLLGIQVEMNYEKAA